MSFVILLIIGVIAFAVYQGTSYHSEQAQRPPAWKENFSSFDGSHKKLVEHMKSRMDDPASFEHVKTTYEENKNGDLNVSMVFRGKNKVGGVITNTAVAEVDKFTGDVKSCQIM